MYHRDHSPPHFHAKYGEYEALFAIDDLKIIKGNLPVRVAGLVFEWASLHKDELLKDWELARNEQPLNDINPLT